MDEKIVLVEVLSRVRASDVAIFEKKAEAYAERTGRKPDGLVWYHLHGQKALATAQ